MFALLELSQRAGETAADVTPSTPSAMIPPYKKPPPKQRRKKSGAKQGHPGSARKVPERIDWQQTDRADACPDCGSQLNRCNETRVRYVEDIPEAKPEVTEHTIHRDWCPKCRKKVEPPITDALPGSQIGLRVVVLSAWLHYCLGNTLSQIVDVFGYHMHSRSRRLPTGGSD